MAQRGKGICPGSHSTARPLWPPKWSPGRQVYLESISKSRRMRKSLLPEKPAAVTLGPSPDCLSQGGWLSLTCMVFFICWFVCFFLLLCSLIPNVLKLGDFILKIYLSCFSGSLGRSGNPEPRFPSGPGHIGWAWAAAAPLG